MRKLFYLLTILAIFFSVNTTQANVFAFDIQMSPLTFDPSIGETTTISFRLNEDADNGVNIYIYDGSMSLVRTLTMATGTRGLNQIVWDGLDDASNIVADGNYTIEVEASDDGYGSWTQISIDTMCVLYSPRGIQVNNDPTSPYFGMVYIANGTAGTSGNTGAFANIQACYIYYADCELYAEKSGGISWGSFSPMRLQLMSDGTIFAGDYGNDNVYHFDAEFDSASGTLVAGADNNNLTTGQWLSGFYVHEAPTKGWELYTVDDGYDAPHAGVRMYDFASWSTTNGDTGVQVIERPNGAYYQNDINVISSGDIIFSQNRFSPAQAIPLLSYPPYAGTMMTLADTNWTVPDSIVGAYGIDTDQANGVVYLGDRYYDQFYIVDVNTGAVLETVATGRDIRDITYDAAGNVYFADPTSEYWTIFSPDDGQNSFTTPGTQTLVVSNSIPVELTAFTAASVINGIELSWKTATETNNKGFNIERSTDNKEFTTIDFVEGHGTTTEKHSYTYTDTDVTAGTYYYRLRQVDYDGTTEISRSVEVEFTMPSDFALHQNYPNPFNPSTTIEFTVPVKSSIAIVIYDITGTKVAELFTGDLNAGLHQVTFDASQFSSGTYVYTMTALGEDGSKFVDTKKMMLLK